METGTGDATCSPCELLFTATATTTRENERLLWRKHQATRRGRKATRRGSRTHDLTTSVAQRGGRELAARGGEGWSRSRRRKRRKAGRMGARGGRWEQASGVKPGKTTTISKTSQRPTGPTSPRTTRPVNGPTADAHHQTQAHRAQTQNNHPRTRTRRNTLKSPNTEKIPRSLIRVPNACGRISQ